MNLELTAGEQFDGAMVTAEKQFGEELEAPVGGRVTGR